MSLLRQKLSKIENYPEHLEKMWRKHRRKKKEDAPVVISTFAGCGGSSLGYSMAGYKELLAVEWEEKAVEIYKANIPGVPVFGGDIRDLSVKKCLELANIEKGELDLFDGSPPCQGFSQSGKRILKDVRNYLFVEYIRLLNGLKPKTFIMENVTGMVRGKMKLLFAEIIKELKDSGYNVKAVVYNMKYFGVPQARERIIFLGIRNDIKKELVMPVAKYLPVTVLEAWGGERELPGKSILIDKKTKRGAYSQALLQGKCMGTLHPKRHYFNTFKLSFHKPSPTMLTSVHQRFIHPVENRFITDAEIKRLGAFPDSFDFDNNLQLTAFGVGNSVPPLFMMEIAKHIRKAYLNG